MNKISSMLALRKVGLFLSDELFGSYSCIAPYPITVFFSKLMTQDLFGFDKEVFP